MIGVIDEGTRLGNGRYTLERRLGKGGAATVWLGEDNVLERPVAVKVLSEGLASDGNWLARFGREARIAAGLSHPNLVSVYDFDADDVRPYIVMAHMPGGSLWDRMQLGEASEPERLARELLTALDAIHVAGIIHRDIKPGNVLFDANGTACLTDFGVARPEDATSLTQTGQIPGTGKFMAPELWKGEPADERTDLYAAGVLLSEAIGNDASPELRALIDRMGSEDRKDRPGSAAAALDELAGPRPAPATVSAPVSEAPTPPRPVMVQGKHRSNRGPVLAGLALLAVIAAVGVAVALGGGEDDPSSGQGSGGEPTASAKNEGEGSESSGEGSEDEAQVEAGPTEPEITTPTGEGPALNKEGFALIEAGDPQSAVPVLKKAVRSWPSDSTDIEYAYALYNYGNALLLAGKPEKAIPILERRLEFDDQTETVQATLDEARAAAGE